jgi:hypothetical protein
VARKLASKLQRRPLLLVVLLVIPALFGAKFGHGHEFFGLWDGPI